MINAKHLLVVCLLAALCGCGSSTSPAADGGVDVKVDAQQPDSHQANEAGTDLGVDGPGPLPDAAGEVVLVTSDKPTYGEQDTILGTVTNNTQTTVYLDGCDAFRRDRLVNGQWVDDGPDWICFTNPPAAAPLAPGASYDQKLLGHLGGTFRLVVHYGIDCTPNLPLQQAGCASMHKAVSATYTVQAGKETQCWALNNTYLAAVQAALKCQPGGTGQCAEATSDCLDCPCPIYVNDATALVPLQAQWKADGCDTLLWACPAVLCPDWTPGNCNNGTCSAN
jgi:hypothetical protein